MLPRRQFVASGAGAAAAASGLMNQAAGQDTPTPVRLGVMGLSRGLALAKDLCQLPGVEIAYLCDADSTRTAAAVAGLAKLPGSTPATTGDFRDILKDESVDALVCAAPNHWHGPATIMACKAGKHVYVEKPCSHNPQEGEWMVKAAAEYDRCVQMGTQRRSSPGTQAAIAALEAGEIGTVRAARCYYTNLRPSVGTQTDSQPPPHLDYELWQGPVPRRPYRSNIVHYNWHWQWHYGGGELANNGVHALDLCRWGLGVDYPNQVTSSGGRYWFEDDQQTPDAQTACFEFDGGKRITWEAHSCNKHGVNAFCEFYGDQGALELDADGQFRIYDQNDKLIREGTQASGGQTEHLQNFVDSIRAGDPTQLNQPILDGHKSTLLCHLGNIAYRTASTLRCDPTSGRILASPKQQQLWQRDYDPAWVKSVSMS